MFTYAYPAEVGVSAKHIKKYISVLERYGVVSHSIIMARDSKIFFEKYWAPFNADFKHRLYSSSKSFVSIAIGFMVQDGLVSLSDKMVDFFPEYVPDDLLPNVKNQTIRDMLMMSTGFIESQSFYLQEGTDDRVKFYFEKSRISNNKNSNGSKRPGEFYEYDSNGTFMLGAIVERISGKSLVDYLKEKLFDKIGVSQDLKCLKSPGGHAWSDSGIICTSMDFLKVANFVMNYGKVGDEKILSEDYLREATSRQIDNSVYGAKWTRSNGYGYQFWRGWNNSFAFIGAGCQFAICVPDKKLVFVCTGDNQANYVYSSAVIMDRFFEEIVDLISDEPLPAEPEAQAELEEYCKDLKLFVAEGEKTSEIIPKISGKTFVLNENPMNVEKVKLTFCGDEGTLEYNNLQGEKVLRFGLGKNVFTTFPETGYSGEFGGMPSPGNTYECAVSAGWLSETKLGIVTQIIDEYFGRVYMQFSFKEENEIAMLWRGDGEAFLYEYNGYAEGTM